MANSRRRRRTGKPKANGSVRGSRQVPELLELAPFSVFCALHLGITPEDGWSQPDPGEVARRFGMSRDELDSYLRENSLMVSDLREADFDLDGARLDIQVAPEGISRCELARPMFADVKVSRR
jgi:hypothetical protein